MVGIPGHIYQASPALEDVGQDFVRNAPCSEAIPAHPLSSALSSQRSDLQSRLKAFPALPCFLPLLPFIDAISQLNLYPSYPVLWSAFQRVHALVEIPSKNNGSHFAILD